MKKNQSVGQYNKPQNKDLENVQQKKSDNFIIIMTRHIII